MRLEKSSSSSSSSSSYHLLLPSSLIFHPSLFILHISSLILHPSSISSSFRMWHSAAETFCRWKGVADWKTAAMNRQGWYKYTSDFCSFIFQRRGCANACALIKWATRANAPLVYRFHSLTSSFILHPSSFILYPSSFSSSPSSSSSSSSSSSPSSSPSSSSSASSS